MSVLTEEIREKLKDLVLSEENLAMTEEDFAEAIMDLFEEAVTQATETHQKEVKDWKFKAHFHQMTHGLTEEQRQRLWKLCDEMEPEMATNVKFLESMRDLVATPKGSYKRRTSQDWWGDTQEGRAPEASPDGTFYREATNDPLIAAALAITEASSHRMPTDPYGPLEKRKA